MSDTLNKIVSGSQLNSLNNEAFSTNDMRCYSSLAIKNTGLFSVNVDEDTKLVKRGSVSSDIFKGYWQTSNILSRLEQGYQFDLIDIGTVLMENKNTKALRWFRVDAAGVYKITNGTMSWQSFDRNEWIPRGIVIYFDPITDHFTLYPVLTSDELEYFKSINVDVTNTILSEIGSFDLPIESFISNQDDVINYRPRDYMACTPNVSMNSTKDDPNLYGTYYCLPTADGSTAVSPAYSNRDLYSGTTMWSDVIYTSQPSKIRSLSPSSLGIWNTMAIPLQSPFYSGGNTSWYTSYSSTNVGTDSIATYMDNYGSHMRDAQGGFYTVDMWECDFTTVVPHVHDIACFVTRHHVISYVETVLRNNGLISYSHLLDELGYDMSNVRYNKGMYPDTSTQSVTVGAIGLVTRDKFYGRSNNICVAVCPKANYNYFYLGPTSMNNTIDTKYSPVRTIPFIKIPYKLVIG